MRDYTLKELETVKKEAAEKFDEALKNNDYELAGALLVICKRAYWSMSREDGEEAQA